MLQDTVDFVDPYKGVPLGRGGILEMKTTTATLDQGRIDGKEMLETVQKGRLTLLTFPFPSSPLFFHAWSGIRVAE